MLFLTLALATATTSFASVSLRHPSPSPPLLVDEFSLSVAENMMPCPCSPSARRFRLPPVFDAPVRAYNAAVAGRRLRGALPTLHRHHQTAVVLFGRCAARFGFEACVNRDAEMRKDTRVTVCIFDRASGRNLARSAGVDGFWFVKPCDESVRFRSPDRLLAGATPASPDASIAPADAAPTARPGRPTQSSPAKHGWRPTQSQPAAEATATVLVSAASSGEAVSERPPPIPLPSRVHIPRASESPSAGDAGVSEGCIAVEHLHGLALQHKKHLVREVLCWDGFCATRNHAIIVDGRWTSLGEICRREMCSKDMKLVNNMDVFVNWKAPVGARIVVTPYDARFPRFFVWVAQFVGRFFG